MAGIRSGWSLAAITLATVAVASVRLSAQVKEEDRRFKLAQGYEMSGDIKNAARVYKELYDLDPKSNVYFDGVRRTYIALLRFADLLPIVEERLKQDPNSVELHSLHADLLNRNRRHEEALAEWRDALDLRPRDETSYVIVAQAQSDNRLFEDAVATFRQGRETLGDRFAFSDQLAQLYAILGRFDESTREYVMVLGATPARLNYVISGLGLFTINPSAADIAIGAVKKASDARPEYLPFIELLEWLYTERGNYDGSLEIAKRLDLLRNGRGSNVFGFADRALRDGNATAAIAGYEYFMKSYTKENPLYANALVGYAKALERRYRDQGNASKSGAREIADRYAEFAGDFKGTPAAAEALMELARIQADDLDEPKDALATLDRIRSDYPRFVGMPEAMFLQGELNLRIGEIARAKEIFKLGTATTTNGADAQHFRDMNALRLAEALFYTGAFKDAADAFTSLTQNTASDATNDALQYLFLLQENLEKNDEALKHYATGRLKLVQKRWQEAIDEMGQALTLAPQSSLADDAMMGKAMAQEGKGELPDAVATLLDLVKNYHDGTMADRALFHAAELTETKLNDAPKALELYTRLLTEYPDSPTLAPARQRIRVLRGNS